MEKATTCSNIELIRGHLLSREVFVLRRGRPTTERLDPQPSLALRNHSPDGFAWGYGGSGPSQLALAIMLLYVDEQEAMRFYMAFKFAEVARWEQGRDFKIPGPYIEGWINCHRFCLESAAAVG